MLHLISHTEYIPDNPPQLCFISLIFSYILWWNREVGRNKHWNLNCISHSDLWLIQRCFKNTISQVKIVFVENCSLCVSVRSLLIPSILATTASPYSLQTIYHGRPRSPSTSAILLSHAMPVTRLHPLHHHFFCEPALSRQKPHLCSNNSDHVTTPSRCTCNSERKCTPVWSKK